MPLEIKSLSKAFSRYPALSDITLTAAEGEFLALLGPSGSGKTTLLRILAGLEQPDAGEVRFRGEDLLAAPVRRRGVGMVFQHYALFRHMTVEQNIAFGLQVRPRASRPGRAAIAARVAELLDLMQLDGLGKRYPSQLSGGQRQRVALARALAIEPRMLLLDEPFGALDAQVRRELRRWLRQVHDRAGVTTVFVTHDQEEALDLADRVAVLRAGELVQVGAPNDVYENPASAFVFDFLGEACRLEGVVRDGRLTVADWTTTAPADAPEGPVDLFFRPNEVAFAPADGVGVGANVLAAAVRGASVKIECKVGEQVIELQGLGQVPPQALTRGARLRFTPTRYRLFAAAR
ncbi:MAG: sulfate/molybdate ABC transporter ATP-binding protein [Caulobacteraceae bacterium]|nr:sulfate/molybdate ABC transporter ATP-binding protein [Caulobacteraceae bacterium]